MIGKIAYQDNAKNEGTRHPHPYETPKWTDRYRESRRSWPLGREKD